MNTSKELSVLSDWRNRMFTGVQQYISEDNRVPLKEEEFDLALRRAIHLSCSPGPFFYMVLDHQAMQYANIGGGIEQILGFRAEEMQQKPIGDFMLECFHPDDVMHFFNFSKMVIDYAETLPFQERFKLKWNFYYRMIDKKGVVKYIFHQGQPLLANEKGILLASLEFFSDISHLRHDDLPMMSILNFNDEKNQEFFTYKSTDFSTILTVNQQILTKREQEIIRLLSEGCTSNQIAYKLHISPTTVNNHRQNMLRKTHTSSTAELVKYAILEGII
jgi:DNA-binding CsgD family transcriptional regulator